jgi:hypothetical protein
VQHHQHHQHHAKRISGEDALTQLRLLLAGCTLTMLNSMTVSELAQTHRVRRSLIENELNKARSARTPMQSLVEAPLADPLKTHLPFGRQHRTPRSKADQYDGVDAPRLTSGQLDERRRTRTAIKLGETLDYYATTMVPFERVAQHTGLTIEQASEAMRRRGRDV